MKLIRSLFLFVNITSNTVIAMEHRLITPENTDIYSDVDEVFIEKQWSYLIKLICGGIIQAPLNTPAYLQALLELDKRYEKNCNGQKELLRYKDGEPIEGITFHFLYHGMHNKNLTPYVNWMIESMESSRQPIRGTKTIYKNLKNKGYPINFATNKDRIAYDLTAHYLEKTFSSIPTKVFVAHPGNNKKLLEDIKQFAYQATTDESYQNLAHRALTIQESPNIIHAPSRKPEAAYFQCLINHSKSKKHIIFIDDNKLNVDGFNALQNTTSILLHGILFTDPIQLAEEFIKLGILSEEADELLLEEIQNQNKRGCFHIPFCY